MRCRHLQPSPPQLMLIVETRAPGGVFVAVAIVGSYRVLIAVAVQPPSSYSDLMLSSLKLMKLTQGVSLIAQLRGCSQPRPSSSPSGPKHQSPMISLLFNLTAACAASGIPGGLPSASQLSSGA